MPKRKPLITMGDRWAYAMNKDGAWGFWGTKFLVIGSLLFSAASYTLLFWGSPRIWFLPAVLIGGVAFPCLLVLRSIEPWVIIAYRQKRNECYFCGYNLHGLTHRRCPECGTTN